MKFRRRARTYIVRPGDTLGSISRQFYGTSARYGHLQRQPRPAFEPEQRTVGQTLIIP
ncbi:MAG: LysM peptidoglycan-binding domain-containing protein [Acidobacteria bacterium]|nr:LysM peptidoglycan-binding domain-containing protein [Acidobacteriota bacterium]